MKKVILNRILYGRSAKKLLLIMKLTALFIVIGLMQVSATVYSQATKFSFRAEDKQIVDVLKEIEESSNFRFFYIREQVDVERRVSVNAKNETVEEILDEIFKGEGIGYKVMEDYLILLKPENQSIDIETVSSQQGTISGKVIDSNGEPLPGVTVVVKGTTKGTVTDENGNYSLTNIPSDATLVFSFVGLKTQQVEVGEQTTINISMVEETVGIDEVVAVGYGTMKKSDLTGSVSQVKSEELNAYPSTNVFQALSGRSTGVQVIQSTGAPGASTSIRIRGSNSIQGSNEPLYVVDGFPINNPTALNNSDIESIEILKDASSTAIYGSRGANGVIITTKKGRAGENVIDFESS